MIIPIQKERIPYRFEIKLGEEVYTFEIHYNAEHDYFTFDLHQNNEVLALGERIVYDYPLFDEIESFPVDIIARDESGQEDIVTYDNFYHTVFLYVEERGNA